MRLLTLDADNWFGYESLHIDFSRMGSVAITGLNDHGKSAILDAITFDLYGTVARKLSRRSPDQFIRDDADALMVALTFSTSDGRHVRIVREKQRGATAAVNLYVDGVEQTGGKIEETQARITELVGLEYPSLMASAFMLQRDSGAFMTADPRERKDLLIEMLGLDQYEPLHKAAKAIADRAAVDRDAAASRIGQLDATIAAGANARVEHEAAQEALARARVSVEEAQEALADNREQYQIAAAERNRIRASVERARQAADQRRSLPEQIDTLREQIAAAEAAAAEPEPIVRLPPPLPAGAIEDAEGSRDNARLMASEGRRLQLQLQTTTDRLHEAEERRSVVDTVPCGAVGIYATCPLLTSIPSEEDLAAVRESLARTEESLAAVAAHAAVADQWDAERTRLLAAQNLYDRAAQGAKIVRERWAAGVRAAGQLAQARRDALAAAQRALAAVEDVPDAEAEAEALAEAERALGERTRANEDLRRAVEEANRVRRTAEELWQQTARRVALVEAAEQQLKDEHVTRDEAAERHLIHAALAAAWHRDGVPTQIIERALPMIEAKANEVLARLPEELTISLRTQRATKGGKGMAETLDAIVTLDGWEREYGLLSWGARLRIDVALRLAMTEILAHRSGRRIQTLWLDEPLADLDTEGVEAMLELLAAIAGDFPLMVVVSHHATFSDAFDHRIEVRKVEGLSHAYVDGEEGSAA